MYKNKAFDEYIPVLLQYGRLLHLWAAVAGIMACTLLLLKKLDPGYNYFFSNKNNVAVYVSGYFE